MSARQNSWQLYEYRASSVGVVGDAERILAGLQTASHTLVNKAYSLIQTTLIVNHSATAHIIIQAAI